MGTIMNPVRRYSSYPPNPTLWDTARTPVKTFNTLTGWGTIQGLTLDNAHLFNGQSTVKFSSVSGTSAYGKIAIGTPIDFSSLSGIELWLYINNENGIGLNGATLYLASVSTLADAYTCDIRPQIEHVKHSGWQRLRISKSQFGVVGSPNWAAITHIRFVVYGNDAVDPVEISLAKLDGIANPASVMIDFDDGYDNVYSAAYPIMEKYGLRGTAYVVTGSIGTAGYMTWAQLRELQAAGWTIGSHSDTHMYIADHTDEEIQADLAAAKAKLIRHGLVSGARFLATPGGQWRGTLLPYVQANYIGNRISGANPAYQSLPPDERYAMRFNNIGNTDAVATITGWIDNTITRKQRLPLLFQNISEPADAATKYLPADFESVCAYIATKRDAGDLIVLTAEEMLLQIGGHVSSYDGEDVLLGFDGANPIALSLP